MGAHKREIYIYIYTHTDTQTYIHTYFQSGKIVERLESQGMWGHTSEEANIMIQAMFTKSCDHG